MRGVVIGVTLACLTAAPVAQAGNGGVSAPASNPKVTGGATVDQYKAPATKAKPRPTAAPRGLRVGARGARVRYLQRLLADLGLGVPVTGLFGPATQAAVKSIQKEAGLHPSGAVSTLTM